MDYFNYIYKCQDDNEISLLIKFLKSHNLITFDESSIEKSMLHYVDVGYEKFPVYFLIHEDGSAAFHMGDDNASTWIEIYDIFPMQIIFRREKIKRLINDGD